MQKNLEPTVRSKLFINVINVGYNINTYWAYK